MDHKIEALLALGPKLIEEARFRKRMWNQGLPDAKPLEPEDGDKGKASGDEKKPQ